MQIRNLFIYPVKGCAGISLMEATVDNYGFSYDRNWMLVDESGRFLSQRTDPALALVRPKLTSSRILLEAPGMGPMELDLTPQGASVSVSVWDDHVNACDVGDIPARWFQQYLGKTVRLVGIGTGYHRNVRHNEHVFSSQVHFGDAFPLLVITQASLDTLNEKLTDAVPMDRFRPNIVIDGVDAHAEDVWQHIRCGDLVMMYGKPCGRCKVTTIDQKTTEMAQEPLKTLATYRKMGNKVCFGSYYLPVGSGRLRVGDGVMVK